MEIIIPSNKRNIIIDATTFTTRQSCGRKGEFRFDMHLQPIEGKGNSLEAGSIMHKILEVTYGHIIKGFNRNISIEHGLAAGLMYVQGCEHCTDFSESHYIGSDSVGNLPIYTKNPDSSHRCSEQCILKPRCNHEVDEYPGVRNTPPISEGNLIGWQYVLETAEQYFDYYKNDSWTPLEIETVKGEVIYEDDEIRILWKAKYDWIVNTQAGIRPVDHKTMKQRKMTVALNNQFKGQCLLMNTQTMFVNKIGYQTSLKPSEKFERPPINYSAAQLMEFRSKIVPYWARMFMMYEESGYHPPNYNQCETKYGMCEFYDACNTPENIRGEALKMKFYVGKAWDIGNVED